MAGTTMKLTLATPTWQLGSSLKRPVVGQPLELVYLREPALINGEEGYGPSFYRSMTVVSSIIDSICRRLQFARVETEKYFKDQKKKNI